MEHENAVGPPPKAAIYRIAGYLIGYAFDEDYSISCPHCQKPENVIKYGTTRSGTQRARCNACNKTFAINPKSRKVTKEKEEAILRQLEERTSIRGVCRSLKCTAHTVYATLKKRRVALPL